MAGDGEGWSERTFIVRLSSDWLAGLVAIRCNYANARSREVVHVVNGLLNTTYDCRRHWFGQIRSLVKIRFLPRAVRGSLPISPRRTNRERTIQ